MLLFDFLMIPYANSCDSGFWLTPKPDYFSTGWEYIFEDSFKSIKKLSEKWDAIKSKLLFLCMPITKKYRDYRDLPVLNEIDGKLDEEETEGQDYRNNFTKIPL